jgi:hypothetical protein
MSDETVEMQMQVTPSTRGIEVLAITAGIGNGWNFKPSVLQKSLSLWDKAECYTDHTLDKHSVRDLGGILSDPQWDETSQGIKAILTPAGPAAQVVKDLADASLNHPDLPIGMSADIFMRVDKTTVLEIVKVKSLDVVMHPARGGKFIRVLNSEGEYIMTEEVVPNVPKTDQPITQTDQTITKLANGAKAVVQSLQAQAAFDKLEASNAAAEKLQVSMCQALLQTALASSRLPEAWQLRIKQDFKDKVFEPEQLQKRIEDDRSLISATMGARTVQSGAVNSMFTAEDQIQAAFDDLLGAPRDAGKETLKVARLTGIREAYLMLTGDYDLRGGYDPIRAQFGGTTTDFTGLVKNALNKVIVNSFERMGKAGYDWWKQIVTVEHFNSLNSITGTLIGTIGSLPTVAEQAEYTELAVGDNPETASFTKYGGYIPLTLEAIDRDDTRKLKLFAIELGNAAMRNISEQVAAIFTSNAHAGPTMADTGALFNATAVTTVTGHANLLTTTLGTDYTAWDAVAAAVYNQPMLIKQAVGYYGTGKKLAIEPKFCLVQRHNKGPADALFLPRWASAVTSIATAGGPTYGGMVIPIVVPEWTDTENWAAVCDPAIAPSIIVGERFGLVPEVYIANRETDPAVFMNDEHRLKVRQFLAICVGDYRPLHKNNIAD